MSQASPNKKRSSLESIVGKLSREVAAGKLVEVVPKASESSAQDEEMTVTMEGSADLIEQDLYLVPSNPSSPPDAAALSDPVSPSGSEDGSRDEQSDSKEDVKEDKQGRKRTPITVPRKRSSLGGFISKAADYVPKDPMRCDVCGLRVYKSYRYISRTSAPLHLKSFVTPSVDRFRVCKRCFSSRERCRQNLALILLKSQTSQMVHLRTPLGVTNTRATQGMEYIVRDLKDKLKRPYDDLMCDETLLDEDEMSNEDFEETDEKNSQPAVKVVVVENGNFQPELITPLSSKTTGMVTLVRPQSGVFSSTPNCYTLYSEGSNLKKDVEKIVESGLNAPAPNQESGLSEEPAEVKEKKIVNGVLSTEINSINNKLTLLDHAYALPPPKSRGPAAKTTFTPTVSKPTKPVDVKANKSLPGKSSVKKETSDDKSSPVRTCGIVCSLCDKLVTKSYSCYNKDNAPEKVQQLFKDDTKIVKVCRRCCPYKKPKVEGEVKVNKKPGKLVKGKIVKVKKSGKIKMLKATNGKMLKVADSGKGKCGKMDTSPQGAKPKLPGNTVKSDQTDGKDGEKRVTEKAKISVAKVSNAGSQTDKTVSKSSTKEMKVEKSSPGSKVSTKATEMTMKEKSVPKEDCKVAEVQTADHLKSSMALVRCKGQPSKYQSTEKTKVKEEFEAPSATDKMGKKTESAGTQSSCSLIGVKMKLKANVGSAEKDALNVEKKVDSVTSKLSEIEKDKKEAISKDLKLKVNAKTEVGKSGDGPCEMNDSSQKLAAAEAEDKSEDVQQEIRQALQGRDRDMVQKREIEAKNDLPKETAAREKKGEEIAEKCKGDGATKNEATATKYVEHKTKDKAEFKNEVSSPRRGRNASSASTPERRKDSEKSLVPTVMTRKRLASLSETETEVSKQGEEPGLKRRALGVLRDRVLNKTSESDGVLPQTSNKPTQQAGDEVKGRTTNSSDDKPSQQKTGRTDEATIDPEKDLTDDSQGANKSKYQAPIKCAACNHRVVKSYRCIQRDASPNHVKSLFKDAEEILRICRRCLKPGQGKYKL